MIFPDVNILLYAHDEASAFHKSASAWLTSVLVSEQVFFSWQTITGFLRIITNKKLSSNPLSLEQAIEIVNSWLQLDNAHLIALEKKNWSLFVTMMREVRASGNLIMDAHIAATAASCGATVASTDRDFTRFPGLQFSNPIART